MRTGGRILVGIAAAYALVVILLYFSGAGGIKRHHVESAIFFGAAAWMIGVAVTPAGAGSAGTGTPSRLAWFFVPAALLLYWPAVHLGLLSDDYVLLEWARKTELLPAGYPFARPVPLALWHAAAGLGGGARSLHLLNVLLHGVNAALVCRIGVRLGFGRLAALLAASVFLLWPTQVEPVMWTAGVFDVMTATFVLAGACIVLGDRFQLAVQGGVIALITMGALLTKETAVALPLLLLLLMGAAEETRPALTRHAVAAVLSAVCTGAYLVWRLAAGKPMSGIHSPTRYALKEQVSRTFANLAVPFSGATLVRHSWEGALVAVSVITAAALMVILATRRGATHGVAIRSLCWCIVAAAPAVGYLFVGDYLEGSRYLYVPAAGWGLFIGALIESLSRSRRGAMLSGAVATLALLLALIQQRQLVHMWQAAARERDRILAQAVSTSRHEGCSKTTFKGVPGTYEGAQLFNNGLPEAFAASVSPDTASASCTLTWTGNTFVRVY